MSVLVLPDASKVRVLRYDDPVMGPRHMPLIDQPEKGKTALNRTDIFAVDLSMSQLRLQENGATRDIGTQLMYIVD